MWPNDMRKFGLPVTRLFYLVHDRDDHS